MALSICVTLPNQLTKKDPGTASQAIAAGFKTPARFANQRLGFSIVTKLEIATLAFPENPKA
jgi:starvation-inducible outer membrane lipoprotein